MDHRIGNPKTQEFARRWHRLALRRRDHLTELFNSGRWRKYFKENEIQSAMIAADRTVAEWEALAGAAADGGAEPSLQAGLFDWLGPPARPR